jgi:hypothetical protein
MRFAYARTGGPLLDWSGPTPPSPSRAGETRSLGDWAPSTRSSAALRRYGGRLAEPRGAAIGYEMNRQLGSLDLPRPGAPEVVAGYESPAPGAAVVHLGHTCTWDEAHRRAHASMMSGYMPEGAARSYGQTMLSADAPTPKQFDMGLVRKASVIAAAYHGVKRHNGSVLWGLLWGLAAYIAPLYGTVVPAIGIAQGFGQAKGPKQNPARRRAGNRYRRRAGGRGLKRGAKARRMRLRRAANKIRRGAR